MAYIFGDSFDCYSVVADMIAGYWDSGSLPTLQTAVGRFGGSQSIGNPSGATGALVKSSGANDAVHHIVCAFRQSATLTGTQLGFSFQFQDSATSQCSIVFRSDGAILLTSGAAAGTVLATYSGAVSAQNTWFAFEFEIIVSNTVGGMRVRKNGNTSNDFDSFISVGNLNTRTTANNYANRLAIGGTNPVVTQYLDDLLWRSDASSVPWVGDVRCYTRMPVSDVSAQFSRAPSPVVQTPFASTGPSTVTAGVARYTAFTATFDGTISTASISFAAGYTGNLKCSMFASSGSAPTTVLGSATTITNPVLGLNTFTFGTPITVTKGTQYWIGFDSDTTAASSMNTANSATGLSSTTAYASFPVASPVTASTNAGIASLNITPTANYQFVNEAQQDGTTSYVYDSTVGHADLYTIAGIATTPASTVAVTTRVFAEKLDAGLRQLTVQVKSGATTVQATPLSLANNFGWIYRTDATDPATSTAWTPAAVNALQIGPVLTA